MVTHLKMEKWWTRMVSHTDRKHTSAGSSKNSQIHRHITLSEMAEIHKQTHDTMKVLPNIFSSKH